MKILAVALISIIVASCGDGESEKNSKAKRDAEGQAYLAKISSPKCDIGTPLDKTDLAVDGSFEILDAPNGHKIKNETASQALHNTHYYSINNSTTVQQLCAFNGWTMVQITSPDWLNFVKGWAPDTVFRNIERTGDGARIYVENDIDWDKDTEKFKPQIIAKINKLSGESRCASIDLSSIAMSPTKSSPGKPVFFVACGTGASTFNVWFEPTENSQ